MKRVMLRDAQGRLLGPAESADFIQQWYQALFTRDKSSFHACSFTWPAIAESTCTGLWPSNFMEK